MHRQSQDFFIGLMFYILWLVDHSGQEEQAVKLDSRRQFQDRTSCRQGPCRSTFKYQTVDVVLKLKTACGRRGRQITRSRYHIYQSAVVVNEFLWGRGVCIASIETKKYLNPILIRIGLNLLYQLLSRPRTRAPVWAAKIFEWWTLHRFGSEFVFCALVPDLWSADTWGKVSSFNLWNFHLAILGKY